MTEKIYILSVETSADICGVALSQNNQVIFEYSSYSKNMHDELLAEYTKRILDDSGLQIEDLQAVAISSGPGSFTGLRIGSAFVKALCYGNNPKLISVPTLSAYANNAIEFSIYSNKKLIIAAIPSHKNLFYAQEFDLQGEAISDITVISKEDFIANYDANKFYCGTAISKTNFHSISSLNIPSAKMISDKAWNSFINEDFINEETFEPNYIQEFVPKVSSKILNI